MRPGLFMLLLSGLSYALGVYCQRRYGLDPPYIWLYLGLLLRGLVAPLCLLVGWMVLIRAIGSRRSKRCEQTR